MLPPVTCTNCHHLEPVPLSEREYDFPEYECTHGLLVEAMPFRVRFFSLEDAAIFGCIYGEPREGDLIEPEED